MNMRFVIFILFIVGILSYFIGTHKSTSPIAPRIIDRCPTQRRPPQTKIDAHIQLNGHEWNVINDLFLFRFSFPETVWRFEENVIQEREEPISTPGYLYTFLLTYGAVYDASHRAPADIRFLIYPAFCNTTQQWAQFFVTQGWRKEPEDSWTVLFRDDGGRRTRMYFRNQGMFQYAFILSLDPTAQTIQEEDMQRIVKSFQFEKGASRESP